MTLDNIAASEKELIKELRRNLRSIMPNEMYEDERVFQRFLIARNYDLSATELMLRNHINWRKKNKVDEMLYAYTPPKIGEKYFARSKLGFDKEGAPVVYVDFGNMDIRGILKTYTKREIVRFVIHHFEAEVAEMKIQYAKFGKKVDKSVFILNFESLSLSNATNKGALDGIAYLISMYEANYPERLKTAYVINASIYFTLAWTVLKPFLTGKTFQKIKIFGKEGWREELVKTMDPDILPAFLGGTRTDPDGNPMCRTFVDHGEKIPEQFYLNRNSRDKSEVQNAKKLFITPMSKEEIKLEVTYPGSIIQWMFETRGRDIGFSLNFKSSENHNSKMKELIPKQRVDTEISPESGMFTCQTPGIYILEFDNTYSWMHPKELYYSASVEIPNENNLMLPE